MTNRYVTFVTDEHLIGCISELYTKYAKAKEAFTKRDFNKNKVDVFKMLFDKRFNNLTDEELVEKEIMRQVDRTIVNAIGIFHENILAGVDGYTKVLSGIDIKSDDDKIFIELKNKHNTVKGEDKKSIFLKLQEEIKKHPNSQAYFARILDKKSTYEKWDFSHKGEAFSNEKIFIISGDQLYRMVTGREDALFNLYQKLPLAIDDFLGLLENKEQTTIQSSALKEFKEDICISRRQVIDEITYSNYQYYLGFDKL